MKFSPPPFVIALLAMALPIISCTENDKPQNLDTAIGTLDMVLNTQNDTLNSRLAAAAALSRICAESPSIHNYRRAAGAYDGIDNDSAIVYTDLALKAATDSGDSRQAQVIAIDYARHLAKSAMPEQAINVLAHINTDSLSHADKAAYYSVKGGMYIDAADAQTLAPLRARYTSAAIGALDTLRNLINPETPAAQLVAAQLNYLRDNTSLAMGELADALDSIGDRDPAFPVASRLMARFYKDRPGKTDEYMYYLALAATADARNGNAEAAALVELGTEFFRQGDLDRAYNYLTASSEQTVRSNSKKLYQQIVPTMPALVETMRAREEARTHRIIGLIVALALLTVGCGILVWHYLHKDMRQQEHNRRLDESVVSRDMYIKQLFDLCAVYLDGLEEFNRLVSRKLKVNQTQDLYKMIESGKVMQDQTERFFDVFDTAVFNIFPDFISNLNALLLPDRQVTAASGGRLTPELRIVAFMRLGVTDSTRLAKFLGLSLNTVYTYRNRMKNRAKKRETFETDILSIGKKA